MVTYCPVGRMDLPIMECPFPLSLSNQPLIWAHCLILYFIILFFLQRSCTSRCFFISIVFLLFLRLHTNIRGALLGVFLFHLAPYRILNIYIRGAVPEFFAGVFFPLVLIALYKWIKEEKKQGLFVLVIAISGLLLTHPFTLVIYSFFLCHIQYIFFTKERIFP